jgi:hypothetical protein
MNETETALTAQQTSEVSKEAAEFELAQRKAAIYAKSDLVPAQFKNNIGNVLIAQNLANRLGADIMMVMQNLYVVHGNPAWSAKFLIACFNKCGKYGAIKYRMNEEETECCAETIEFATGEVITGVKVSLEMAAAEGWSKKSGSKWKTMPSLMLRYRAAAFLIRTTAPEISMGISTREEEDDLRTIDVPVMREKGLARLGGALSKGEEVPEPDPKTTGAREFSDAIESMDAEQKGGLFPTTGEVGE